MYTSKFECYLVRCGSKNKQHEDMCLKESGLHAQYMQIILGSNSQHNGGDLYDHLMSMRIFTLDDEKDIIWAPKMMSTWMPHDLDLLIILHMLRVLCPTRSGCREKSIQIAHVYITSICVLCSCLLLVNDTCKSTTTIDLRVFQWHFIAWLIIFVYITIWSNLLRFQCKWNKSKVSK